MACAPRTDTARPCPQARSLQAVPRLVKLFNHANQEVQRHATGAMRNLIYDSADNKLALVEENGIFELMRTLREQDSELRKNVTGARSLPSPACVARSALLLLSLFCLCAGSSCPSLSLVPTMTLWPASRAWGPCPQARRQPRDPGGLTPTVPSGAPG